MRGALPSSSDNLFTPAEETVLICKEIREPGPFLDDHPGSRFVEFNLRNAILSLQGTYLLLNIHDGEDT